MTIINRAKPNTFLILISNLFTEIVGFSDKNDYTPYSNRVETYVVPIICIIIFFVGVIGNFTVILIFIRERGFQNIPNTYIFSLAVGDFLLLLTWVPFTSMLYTIESWPYGEAICKISELSKDISTGVSVFTLTALSAERYYAIVNPIARHINMSSVTTTFIIAVGIWVLSVILAIPSGMFSHLLETDIVKANNQSVNIVYCYPFPKEFGSNYPKFIVMSKFLCFYAIPLFIITCFYIPMASHLIRTTRNMPGENIFPPYQLKARKKVAIMVLIFIFIFVICFLPYHTFMIWYHFHPDSEELYNGYWHTFRIVGFALCLINSCINPIALYLLSKMFRKYFKQYLFCCTSKNCKRSGAQRRRNDAHHPNVRFQVQNEVFNV